MRFMKTIDLWCERTVQAIESGKLRLQCGQWVRCGSDKQLSRFIAYHPKNGTFDVVHGGSNKQVMQKFKMRMYYKAKKQQRGAMYVNSI